MRSGRRTAGRWACVIGAMAAAGAACSKDRGAGALGTGGAAGGGGNIAAGGRSGGSAGTAGGASGNGASTGGVSGIPGCLGLGGTAAGGDAVGGSNGQPNGISAAGDDTCAMFPNGAVACWGDDSAGQLGDCSTAPRARPAMIPGVSGGLLNFSMAARRTCVIVPGDGGVSGGPVICWGPGPPAAVAGIAAANGLAVSDDHVCVTTAIGGNVLCWGDNTYGQLGDGTTTSSDVAVPVGGLTEVMIKAGPQFSCASNLAGTTWCWGQNMGGQLGNGTTTSSGQPVKVLPDPAGIVFITGQHVYANVGAVSCWGTGACGDGGGPNSVRLTPTRVALGGPALTEPAGGDATSCTVLVGGSVECWGANDHGQLGDGTVVDHLTPGAVLLPSGEQAKYISATADGSSFYALMTDSSVYAWGRNDRGQLGDGTATDRSTPVRVVGVATPYGVTAGAAHACSQTSSFAVQCWGANDLGQLGDGTFVDRPTPVTISF